MFLLLLQITFVLFVRRASSQCPTKPPPREVVWEDILQLERELIELVVDVTKTEGRDGRFLLPLFVHNSFVDCIGGCDGCINLGMDSFYRKIDRAWPYLDRIYEKGNSPPPPFSRPQCPSPFTTQKVGIGCPEEIFGPP